jgi:hypothetical protein
MNGLLNGLANGIIRMVLIGVVLAFALGVGIALLLTSGCAAHHDDIQWYATDEHGCYWIEKPHEARRPVMVAGGKQWGCDGYYGEDQVRKVAP